MVFVVVVVVVFEKWLGPVNGFGGTQAFSAGFVCFKSINVPGPPGHPWAFPMVFVFVVVVVVVVVFEKWSGPVNGFGCTRSISGVQFWCVCVYFNSSGNVVKHKE